MKTKYIWLLAVLLSFAACNNDDDSSSTTETLPPLTAGDADFSNYVAVGASFTAGFSDNALFIATQENSFPNILSQKFDMLGGGSFTQPLMNDNIGGLLFNGMQMPDGSYAPRLYFNGSGPAGLPATPTTEATTVLGGTFNNMGVPGAKSFHLGVEGYGFANPYFGRMASNPMASVMVDAVAQNPTFFTLSEIGGNDVLSYATSGGTGVDQTGNYNPATYGVNDITDPIVFATAFNAAVDALVLNGAKGVVTNVPYITSLPHFTTVTYNPIPLDAGTAAVVNGAYAAYNGGIVQAFAYLVGIGAISQEDADAEIAQRTIMFEASETNAAVILDEDLTDLTGINPQLVSMRQATADDLIVLPAMNFIGTEAVPGNPLTVNGVAIPLADKWVLTPEEQQAIRIATDAYNATIESVATANGLALVDFKGILQQASTTGIESGNYILNTVLVRGGLVSLDGIHLTSRGYSVMANEMMRAIDATYGSNFEASGNFVDCGEYPTNYSPTLQ
ncbi:SGNH/GDSL hydrolase family protein [Formosa maritima]|uniref:G-D-S-L family lipolytic protein n=1 Tax=Formosa maritima TaxID=2592046 RepID=A0A5D0GRH8_9FLAO|nr:G-D-S-L family lipolytic protein [Formosa maritima]TYA60132.1 G-D-S-L family lipolytic protein [Formosa maritima]